MNGPASNGTAAAAPVSHVWLSAATLAFRCVVPVFVFFGLSGNAMAWLLIRTNANLRKLPSNVYLLALAVFSSLFLVNVQLLWLDRMLYAQRHYVGWPLVCKVFSYSQSTCDMCSVWLIVLVCLDRAALFRLSTTKRITKRKALCCVLAVLVSALAANSVILYLSTPWPPGRPEACSHDLTSRHALLMYRVYTVFDSVVTCVIPSVLIVLLNSYVVYKLNQRRNTPHEKTPIVHFSSSVRRRASSSQRRPNTEPVDQYQPRYSNEDLEPPSASTASTGLLQLTWHRAKRSLHKTASDNTTPTTFGAVQLQNGVSAMTQSQPSVSCAALDRHDVVLLKRRDLALTRTLVIVSSVFLALNLPNYVLRSVALLADIRMLLQAHILMTYAAYTLLYLHHACLFYLYIFYSPQMKKHLRPTAVRLLECYCLKPVPDFGHAAAL